MIGYRRKTRRSSSRFNGGVTGPEIRRRTVTFADRSEMVLHRGCDGCVSFWQWSL
ncbi:hypothetical protein CROQUDRAFT_86776 [Cronartium quercuum f. sp. fusiforme G11]|uniref:Uncharacterized protein n=1 Tax=Cronartium quercuum f. sp. fusiforme G11 TaxID=708437 RepID=A0A9P6NXI9_9BASI|nr:hypothetical protein CROQUDRAFT_86776 [Cronartium quercuum f. sp. fusiforme G11]